MSNTTTLGALLEEYEQQELTLLPVGEYEVEIASVKPRATDVVPTFKVVSGPYAGKRTMGGTISCNGNAAPRFFARMREAGLDKGWFQALGAEGLPVAEVMKAVADALKGRVVVASFTIEEPNKYHEDSRNKLEKFTRLVSAPQVAAAGVPQVPVAAPVAAAPAAAPVVAAAPEPVAAPVVAAPVVAAAPPPVAAPPAVAPVAAPVVAAAPVAEQQVIQQADVAQLADVVPGVPVVAPVAAPAAPTAPTEAPVAAAAPVVAEAAPAAPAPAAAPAPVAATIQVADEPDF